MGVRTRVRVELALVVVATAWAVLDAARAPRWTVDDAYIVARYAEHLGREGFLGFNRGEAPVEGFTSPLSVAWAAAAVAVGLDALRALDLLAFAALVARPALILATGRAMRIAPPAAGVVAVLDAAIAEHVVHVGSGLETELWVTAGLALALGTARALGPAGRGGRAVGALGALALLVRPEGAAAAAAAIGALAARRRNAPGGARAAALTFGVAVGAVTAARLALFGAIVPNTFHAKAAAWSAWPVRDLGAFAAAYALDLAVATAVAATAAALAGVRLRVPPRATVLAICASAAAFAQLVAYARTEPLMDYARRFSLHALPWLLVLALAGAHVVTSAIARLARRAPRLAVVTATLAVFALAATVARGASARANARAWVGRYDASARELYAPLADWIAAHTPEDALVAVYPDAGLVPHRTRRPTLDFGRLNDARLARHAPAAEDVVRIFFDRAPAVLVVSEPSPGVLWDGGARAIVEDPRFAERYALVSRNASRDGSVAVRLYARKP